MLCENVLSIEEIDMYTYVAAVRDSVAGFVRDGRFLTRGEAMTELAERGRELLYA